MKFIKLSFLLCFLFNSIHAQYCTGNRYSNCDLFSSVDETLNINYSNIPVTDWQGNPANTMLTMDIYQPSGDIVNQRPLVLLIHGGGFKNGDKIAERDECILFAKKGYVAVSINYRLGWTNVPDADMHSPNCLATADMNKFKKATYRAAQDAHAALRFLANNATTYRIDPSNFFVGGSSAGAFTAVILSYMQASEWTSLLTAPVYTAMGPVNTSGNSFPNAFTIKGIYDNWGAIYNVNWITPLVDNIPLIAFHGDSDPIVPIVCGPMMRCSTYITICGSKSVCTRLESLGVCTELNVLTGGGHGIYGSPAGQAYRVSRATCFFKDILCGTCSSPSYPLYNFATSLSTAPPPNCSCTSPRLKNNMSDLEENSSISISPNPTTRYINLHCNFIENGTIEISVYNSIGEQVHHSESANFQHGDFVLDLSKHDTGIYFMKVRHNEEEFSRTIQLIK